MRKVSQFELKQLARVVELEVGFAGPQELVVKEQYESWSGTYAAIVWEEGPYEWAVAAASSPEIRSAAANRGLWVEPINSYALAVYRQSALVDQR